MRPGHALARLTSSSKGDDLQFMTIMPRLDGFLGFVASVARDGNVQTRRTMIEELEVALAGRAAEEVVFGADDVGAGAGGPSSTSDLAVATGTASYCLPGAKAYISIVARLTKERAVLDDIVDILVDNRRSAEANFGGSLLVVVDCHPAGFCVHTVSFQCSAVRTSHAAANSEISVISRMRSV